MRASTFLAMGLACGAIVCAASASPVLAETSAPVAAPASGAKGSDDALSPSTLPKARQHVKESETSQVDELSPDERRRLERLRAKAAAAKAPEKPSPEKAAIAKQPADSKVAAKPQTATPRPDKAAPASVADRRDETKAPAPKKAAQAPAAAAATSRTAEQQPSARPTRQAVRRMHRSSRETANLDRRRSIPRVYPYRRGWPEVADRAPRVGDVVPPDAPLYPVPPGYVGRGYPPFPGDDGYPPPPRRGYAPW